VVLVRATVAEAFRDAKRGGGLKSALVGLAVEGLDGSAFVLSPSARNLVAIALERKPSGTEKSVCMPYMFVEGVERQAIRQMGKTKEVLVNVDQRISKVSTLYVPRRKTSSTVVKQPQGGVEGN
jgi:hypothetical protein